MEVLWSRVSLMYTVSIFYEHTSYLISSAAHWDAGSVSILPSTNWQLEAFLAYGVTTHHK
jgi:hypothetical protein